MGAGGGVGEGERGGVKRQGSHGVPNEAGSVLITVVGPRTKARDI